MDWATMTHEQKLQLCRDGLARGESAAVIAAYVAGASRSAVLGFIHRNKLNAGRVAHRPTVTSPREPRAPKPERFARPVASPKPQPARPSVPIRPTDPGIAFLNGTDGKCRFPLWGADLPPSEERLICGHETGTDAKGKHHTYCDFHERRTHHSVGSSNG